MKARLRWRVLILLAAALVAASLLYTWFWFDAAHRLAAELEAWSAAAAARGHEVQHAGIEVGGFPFSLTARIERPVLAYRLGDGALRWQGGHLLVDFWPTRSDSLAIVLPPLSQLTRVAGGHNRTAWLAVDRATIAPSYEAATRSYVYRLDATGVGIGPRPPPMQVTARTLTLTLRVAIDADESAIPPRRHSIDAALSDIELSDAVEAPFRRRLDRVRAQAALTGNIPEGAVPVALAGWRDGGGTVELETLHIQAGSLMLDATGTLALDRDMRPIGAFTARLHGYGEVLDALVAAGAANATHAATAKIVLDLLATPADDGGPPILEVPISLQDGRLFVGPVSLLRIPPVRWE